MKKNSITIFLILIFNISITITFASVRHINSIANAGRDTILVCQTNFQLNGSSLDVDEIGVWSITSGVGTLTNENSPNATLSDLVTGGTVVLTWNVENNITHIIQSDAVTISNVFPSIASVSVSTITCLNFARISGNSPLYGVGIWSVESGLGTFATVTSPITTVNGLGIGLNIFKWTISGGTCSSNATVSVNFNRAVAGANQILCVNNSVLNATPSSVNSGVWSNVNSALPQIDDGFDPNSLVTDLQPGLNIFRWRTRNLPGGCISDSFVTITSNIVNQADAGTDKIICTDSLILTGNIPLQGVGTWSILTSTSAIITNTTVSNSKIRNLSEGYNVLEWKIKKGICETKDTLYINNDSPSKAEVMSNISICTTSSVISAIPITRGVGNWYTISGFANIINPTNNNASVMDLSRGDVLLGWKTSFGSCPDRKDTLKITSNISEIAFAGNDMEICGDTVQLDANTILGIGTWRIITGSGLILNPNHPKSKVVNVS
ncbi:MAG: hypothetical protein EAZ27_07010, partial [Cytophagales bacterium]